MPLLLARQLAVGTWLRRGMVVLVHGPAGDTSTVRLLRSQSQVAAAMHAPASVSIE